jgi:hypothetical protein
MATDPGAGQRRQLAARGQAMPGGRFPIPDRAHLDAAIKAVGRAKGDHNLVRRYIMRRARALGLSNLIPATWAADGSMKGTQ